MYERSYSYEGLINFCEDLKQSGKYSKAKSGGWLTACQKLLVSLLPEEEADIRRVDVDIAASKFGASNDYKAKTVRQYKTRVYKAISEFVEFVNEVAVKNPEPISTEKEKPAEIVDPVGEAKLPPKKSIRSSKLSPPTVNTISVQIRPGFLAKLVLPLDLKATEARHLCALIKALPLDMEGAS